MITAAQYSSGAENRIAAVETRKRLWGKPDKFKTAAPATAPKPPEPEQITTVEVCYFDQHVVDYFAYKASPIRMYITRRAAELGFTYRDIVGTKRTQSLVNARHRIIWEVKTEVSPEISYPQLGRLFGKRDHTSVLAAIRKMDRLHELELTGKRICVLSPRQLECVQFLIEGLTVEQMAHAMGITYGTALTHINKAKELAGVRKDTALVAVAIRNGWVE